MLWVLTLHSIANIIQVRDCAKTYSSKRQIFVEMLTAPTHDGDSLTLP